MDVLIYAEPTQHSQATIDALATLRSLLLPRYSVQTLTPQALKSQPWPPSCALLVILQSQNVFSSQESSRIKEYVESGGSFLGFGFGAKYISHGRGTADASKDLQFQIGDKSNSVVISSSVYQENHSSQSAAIATPDGELIDGVKSNSGKFVGFEGVKGVNILANYHGDDHGTTIAGLTCQCGRGTAALWAPSLESPLGEFLSEQRRLALLRSTLLSLNLQPPPILEKVVSHPLPQYLTSHPSKPTIVSKIMDSIAMPSPGSQLSVFEDRGDTFHFHRLEESESLVAEIRNSPQSSDPSKWQPKHIILCTDTLPSRNHTPLFDMELYYEFLSAARTKEGSLDNAIPWGMGEVLLYGETVTSTQTLLDKNPRLLSRIATPIVSLASHQLSGRGRGSNVWISPSGSLSFSILLRAPLSLLPASKLVFVQYLFALAVVEACREPNVLGERGNCTRLKWPNDIYAVVGPGAGERSKIGGILVTTSFSSGSVDIIVGCGLNVLNEAPATSLMQLLPPGERNTITLEGTITTIIAKFEKMWTIFVKEGGSFDSFMKLYLERWLHSDQLITLTTIVPPKLARITGITPDHGLLRTMPERTGWSSGDEEFIDLQPDGNSFDLMAGLIRSKTSR